MTFKKINDDTVQCVVSYEDMQEYGLSVSDLFTRSEKCETFLHDMIKKAHDEVGFTIENSNIAMQITPLRDKGLIVTFTDDDMGDLAQVLAGIRDALANGDTNAKDILQKLKDAGAVDLSEKSLPGGTADNEDTDDHYPLHVIAFDSIGDVISYCAATGDVNGVKSALYKYEGRYYLWVQKTRRKWMDYYTMVSNALDFGFVMHGEESTFSHIRDNGECLIASGAMRKLKSMV